jgi:prophage endopeptidase
MINVPTIAGAGGLVVGLLIGGYLTGLVADAKLAEAEKGYAQTLQRYAEQRDSQARRAAQAQQDAAATVAKIDQEHYEELRRAQTEIEQLRVAVVAGTRRLSIKATCPARGPGVPEAATATGVGDAADRADIDPGAAARIVSLTDRGDTAIRQLKACQEYARTVSR